MPPRRSGAIATSTPLARIQVVLPIRDAAALTDDGTMSQEQARDRAVLLSITALAAMAIAYLLIWAVLRDPDMTDKLMNGIAPPGTAVVGNRVAVIGGIIAALGAWTAAITSRRVIPVLLVVLASVPFAPRTLFTLALAFDG